MLDQDYKLSLLEEAELEEEEKEVSPVDPLAEEEETEEELVEEGV